MIKAIFNLGKITRWNSSAATSMSFSAAVCPVGQGVATSDPSMDGRLYDRLAEEGYAFFIGIAA
jgi:hypothetical protein